MISLIIAVYKRLDFLELVFCSINEQRFKDFEVIIAEDAQDPATLAFIARWKHLLKFPLHHISQPDNGFRKTAILNEAVRISAGEKLVFIDGDCILHPAFLQTYSKIIQPGFFYFGRRCRLSPSFTESLKKCRDLKKINLVNLFLSGCSFLENSVYIPFSIGKHKPYRQIWGCNWGVLKSSVLSVNGFDEDYTQACAGEDLDIDWRLKAAGLKIRSVKHMAIVYHLHHTVNYDLQVQHSMEALMSDKINSGHIRCLNGIEKLQAL